MCINCLKPRSNKYELKCKKCGCNYFHVPNYCTVWISYSVMYKNGSIVKN